jgi:hypothetical protein
MPAKGYRDPNAKPRSKQQRAYNSRPLQVKRRSQRTVARRQAVKKHGKAALKGKDVHHVGARKTGLLPRKTRIISIRANRSRKAK